MQVAARIAAADTDDTAIEVTGQCLCQIGNENLVAKVPGMAVAAVALVFGFVVIAAIDVDRLLRMLVRQAATARPWGNAGALYVRQFQRGIVGILVIR